MNKQKLGILSAIWAISLIVTASIVYGFSGPSQTLYLAGGIYPTSASYTIFKEGLTCFAKDAYGNIVSQDTDDSNVLTAVLATSGNIFLKKASYEILANIEIAATSVLISCEVGTVLTVGDDVECFAPTVQMYGFQILGAYAYLGSNASFVYSDSGIAHGNYERIVIEGETDAGYSFYLSEDSGDNYENSFHACSLNNGDFFYVGSEIQMSNCKFGNTGTKGWIHFQSAGSIQLSNCGFERCEVWLESCTDFMVSNCWTNYIPDIGIYLWACTNGTISNYIGFHNQLVDEVYGYGIQLYQANFTTISNCQFNLNETESRAISEAENSNYNLFYAINAYFVPAYWPIKMIGPDSRCGFSYNGTTWIP